MTVITAIASRGVAGQDVGEVVVLGGGAADGRARRCVADRAAEAADEVGGCRVINGGGRGDPHDGAAGRGRWFGDDAGVDDTGIGLRGGDDLGGLAGVDGDEQRRGGAGAERGDEHLVAVAAGSALVDDTCAGHAEAHAERGGGEEQQDSEAGGEGDAGAFHRPGGPAGPAAFGGAVGVVLGSGDEDSVTE